VPRKYLFSEIRVGGGRSGDYVFGNNTDRYCTKSSHYVVTGPLRWPWVRLSLFMNVSPEPQAEEPVMREKLRFLGLDVHAETIAVAVAETNGETRSLGTIANREDSIRKFIKKLGSPEQLRACHEAGPTGFVLYWQLGPVRSRLRSGCSKSGSEEARRLCEDGSAGCIEAGTLSP
jgi:hypothetical protein